MIYELRVYKCVPGRLPALNNRFANITLKMWEKHGIKQAGFWTTLVGESNQELYYLLAWESLADREKKWNALPGRSRVAVAKRAETEKDGPIVANVSNQFLTPTTFFVGQVAAGSTLAGVRPASLARRAHFARSPAT